MKEIQLIKGGVTLVDDRDFPWLNNYRWFVSQGYVLTTIQELIKGKTVRMHRLIMGDIEGVVYDHKNGNRMDNRKENLRRCTARQNCMNQPPRKGKSSKYKGVTWTNGGAGMWRAQIRNNISAVNIGCYYIEEDAARAYDKKAREIQGEFAFLNFPKDGERGLV